MNHALINQLRKWPQLNGSGDIAHTQRLMHQAADELEQAQGKLDQIADKLIMDAQGRGELK